MGTIRNHLSRFAGMAMFLGGATLAMWLVYNLFVDARPEFIESTGGHMRSASKGLVLAVVVSALGANLAFRRRSGVSGDSHTRPPLSHEKQAELRSLIDRGHKIDAIRRYREATGAGLSEAKSYIDRLDQAA